RLVLRQEAAFEELGGAVGTSGEELGLDRKPAVAENRHLKAADFEAIDTRRLRADERRFRDRRKGWNKHAAECGETEGTPGDMHGRPPKPAMGVICFARRGGAGFPLYPTRHAARRFLGFKSA